MNTKEPRIGNLIDIGDGQIEAVTGIDEHMIYTKRGFIMDIFAEGIPLDKY
jgi:hypothetical protein